MSQVINKYIDLFWNVFTDLSFNFHKVQDYCCILIIYVILCVILFYEEYILLVVSYKIMYTVYFISSKL